MFNLFAKPSSLTPAEVHRRLHVEKNVTCIDVRTNTEFGEGHAQGAQNIPLNTLLDHTDELTRYDEVYVMCRSGGRSVQAVHRLLENGVHAINVTGGMNAWEASELPTV